MKKKIIISLVASTVLLEANWNSAIDDLKDEAKLVWKKQTEFIHTKKPDENSTVRYERIRKEHFNAIWEDVIKNLEKALVLNKKITQAPQSTFFGADKESLQKEFNSVLDDIIMLLLDDNLLNYRKSIRNDQEDISALEKAILRYREQKITAPQESHLKTTQSDYIQKISDAKEEIQLRKKRIIQTKLSMSENFEQLGINLTPVQIDVLLSRVDGDDIIAMTLMMDVLKQITVQLLGIMQESGEELHHAKKYYGMHTVLLELVVYVQQNLADKIKHAYIPKIDKILSDTKTILATTNQKISTETNLQRKSIYYKNYEAQKMTFKVATLYKKNLEDELKQISKAKKVSQKNLDLSKNTFETVTLSSDLFKVISTSQEMMQEVMQLQIPAIIPFENMKMQEKFQELTEKIKE